MPCQSNNSNKLLTINHCFTGVRSVCCPKPIFPANKTGFPFSGNTNTPGSRLTSVRRCSFRIQFPQTINLRTKIFKQDVNNFGGVEGGLGGTGMAIRNVF